VLAGGSTTCALVPRRSTPCTRSFTIMALVLGLRQRRPGQPGHPPGWMWASWGLGVKYQTTITATAGTSVDGRSGDAEYLNRHVRIRLQAVRRSDGLRVCGNGSAITSPASARPEGGGGAARRTPWARYSMDPGVLSVGMKIMAAIKSFPSQEQQPGLQVEESCGETNCGQLHRRVRTRKHEDLTRPSRKAAESQLTLGHGHICTRGRPLHFDAANYKVTGEAQAKSMSGGHIAAVCSTRKVYVRA